MRFLSANTLLNLAVAVNATTPVPPDGVGAMIWSTSASAPLVWDGSKWAALGGAGGGGSPSGNDGELQYKSGASFAGASVTEIDPTSGTLKLVSTTDPATPSGGILIYSKLIAGRHMPKMIGPSGVDTVLQTGLASNSIFVVMPSSLTNAPTVMGGTLTTAATMSSAITAGSSNVWFSTMKKRFATGTVAATNTGMRTAYTQWFRGNAAGYGGFFFRAQFGQSSNSTGAQTFVGLCASTAALGTAAGSVSALINMIGVGYDTTDASTGNWFLYRNDGTGTATKVDLGVNAARAVDKGYDLIIYNPPGNNTDIFVRVVNLNTGVVVLETSYNTDLPVVNTLLAFKAETNNGALTAVQNLEIAKVYIETDY